MNTVNRVNATSGDNSGQDAQISKPRWKSFILLGITVGLLALGLTLIRFFVKEPADNTLTPVETITNVENIGNAKQSSDSDRAETQKASASLSKRKKTDIVDSSTRKSNTASVSSASSWDKPDSPWAYSDELITRLFELKDNTALRSEEINEAIHNALQQLLSQSQAAVPAIYEYLQSFEDLTFDERLVRDRIVDEKSLRIALFDVLGRIGGEEAIGVLATQLQSTNSPLEIATLADILERQAPGDFQATALAAARKTFASVSQGELPDVDTAPLFHVFANYGDENTISQLIKSNTEWQIYQAVALGQASEGKGIVGLTQLLQGSKSSSTTKVALRMLAQEASEYPEAQEALIAQARSNNIPDQDWPKLALALTGSYQYQLQKPQIDILATELERNPFRHQIFGGKPTQTLYITDISEISSEQRDARLAVIDELLSENENRVAVQALENARNRLTNRVR